MHDRPVCDWSLLHVDECAHCHGGGLAVVPVGVIERYLQRPVPQYRMRDRRWRVPAPEATTCEHRRDDLCPDCDRLLDGLLYDLPELVHQVGVAMRKDTRFAPHGHRLGDAEHPDEAPIPWSPTAARVLMDLQALTRKTWPDRRALLPALTKLAERAHRIIERPKDREYTMCPRCRAEIVVEDHALVLCPTQGCTYAATWDFHQGDLLDVCGDVMLTAKQLVGVLCANGEPITRRRVYYLVENHGLPREEIKIPDWRDGRIVTEDQWVYRLRDVRDLQSRLARVGG